MFHDSLRNHHLCLTLQLQDTILVLHYSKSQVTHKSRQLVHYSLRWTEHCKITKMHFMQNRIQMWASALCIRFYINPAPLNGSTQFHYCTESNPGTGADDTFVLKRGVWRNATWPLHSRPAIAASARHFQICFLPEYFDRLFVYLLFVYLDLFMH